MSARTTRAIERKKRADRLLGLPLAALATLARALRPRRTPPADVRHVVVAKLWGIGNLAMALPLLAAIRRAHPRARVTILTLARNRPLLEGQPGVDSIVTVRDDGWLAPIADLLAAARRLRREGVDLFLDLEQFLRAAAIVAWIARARWRVGFDTPGQLRAPLYDATAPCLGDRHMAHGFADLVRAAGIDVDGVASHGIVVRPDAARAIDAALGALPRPWVIVHPGSGDNFPGRRWPAERFAALAATLQRDFGGTLLVTGAASEAPLVGEVMTALAALGATARPLVGATPLPQLVALLAKGDLLLSNDTGPVHLAAAVATPVVAFYGPNSPRLYGPLGDAHRALYRPLPCSPCLTNQNGKSSACTLPLCILGIELGEALAAARELLERRFARAAPSASSMLLPVVGDLVARNAPRAPIAALAPPHA